MCPVPACCSGLRSSLLLGKISEHFVCQRTAARFLSHAAMRVPIAFGGTGLSPAAPGNAFEGYFTVALPARESREHR